MALIEKQHLHWLEEHHVPTFLTCARLAQDSYRVRPFFADGFQPLPLPEHDASASGPNFHGVAYHGPSGIGIIAYRSSLELEDWADADLDSARRRLPTDQIGDVPDMAGARRAGSIVDDYSRNLHEAIKSDAEALEDPRSPSPRLPISFLILTRPPLRYLGDAIHRFSTAN